MKLYCWSLSILYFVNMVKYKMCVVVVTKSTRVAILLFSYSSHFEGAHVTNVYLYIIYQRLFTNMFSIKPYDYKQLQCRFLCLRPLAEGESHLYNENRGKGRY